MVKSENDKKEDSESEVLENELERIRGKGEQLINLGAEIKKQGAFVVDLANHGLQAANYAPFMQDPQSIYNAVQGLHNFIENNFGTLMQAQMGYATGLAYHGTATLDAFTSGMFNLQENTPPPLYVQATSISEGFFKLTYHPTLRDEALKQLQRLGLHNTKAGKLATKQLNDAWETHLEKFNSSTPSLLTIRSAIQQVVDELMRRRPSQRPEKHYKIIEIGNQLGASYVEPVDFQKLEADWERLNNELSGSKQGKETRELEKDVLARATTFLVQLLTALDPQKLRPSH